MDSGVLVGIVVRVGIKNDSGGVSLAVGLIILHSTWDGSGLHPL